ncbi:MAG: ATP-binding protein [Betaproteobacteria bacterium]
MPDAVKLAEFSSGQFARRLVAGASLLVLLVVLLAGLSLRQSYDNYDQGALLTARNLSHALAQDLNASFDQVDLVLLTSRDLIAGLPRRGARQQEVDAQMALQLRRVEEIFALVATDATGAAMNGMPADGVGAANVSGRAFFRKLRDAPADGLVVSEPMLMGAAQWCVALARRVNHLDGSFGGVVYALLRLEQFQRKFAALDLGPHGAVSLRDLDLGTVVRHPEPANLATAIGNRTFSREWPEKLKQDPHHGTYFAVGLDGRNRALAYERVTPYPFYVIVGLFPGDYLGPWRTEAWKTAALVLLFAAAVTVFSYAILKLWKEREAASGKLLDRSRSALRHSQQQLELALESAAMGVWTMDASTGRIELDAQARRLHGLEREGPVTLDDIARRLHPDDRALMQSLAQPLGAEDHFVCMEVRVDLGEGGERWVSWRGRVLGVDADSRAMTTGVAQDISAQKKAEERQAAEAQRKDRFVATLAHELRNPLAPIRNAIAILGMKPAPDAQAAQLRQIIDRQAKQLTRLVDDLLDVARIDGGKIPLRLETVDLAQAIEDAVEAARPVIARNGHELSVALPQAGASVVADPTRLTQMVLNLLNNAAKYTPRGGHIALDASSDGAQAVIRVRDDGDGISAEQLPHIFEMFYQAHSASDHAIGGLGIGLALVRTLAERHGGTIEARSDGLGKGSEFVLRLPVAGPTATQATGRKDASARSF